MLFVLDQFQLGSVLASLWSYLTLITFTQILNLFPSSGFQVQSTILVVETLCCTGCPQKKFHLLYKTITPTITPLKIVVGIKVRGDSESAGAELSVEYHNFPVAQQGAKIFEFKVDPVPKLTF